MGKTFQQREERGIKREVRADSAFNILTSSFQPRSWPEEVNREIHKPRERISFKARNQPPCFAILFVFLRELVLLADF
jgi:hypothetical protein